MMKNAYFLLFLVFFIGACAQQPIRKSYTPEPEADMSPKLVLHQNILHPIEVLYQEGRYTEAFNALNRISEKQLRPLEQADYHNLKGLIFLAQQNAPLAEASFRQALFSNLKPEYRGYIQYNIAIALYTQNRHPEALQTLNTINLEQLDPPQRNKAIALKQKLIARSAGANPSPAASSTGSSVGDFGTAGATGSATAGAMASPTPTPEPYSGSVKRKRIGLLIPLSGKYENFGMRAQKAIELAFQHSTVSDANEFELIPVDSGDTVETLIKGLQTLVEEHEVIAIIGPLLSKGIESLAEKIAYYQVPTLSIAQVQGLASDYFFSCSISNRDQVAKLVDYAMRVKNYTRFAVLAPSNGAGQEMAQAFWDEVEARHGEIKAYELYEPNLTDFRHPVDRTIGLFYTEARKDELEKLAEQRTEMNVTKKTMKTAQYYTLPPIIDFDAVFIADDAKVAGQIIPTFAFRDAKKLSFFGTTAWNSPQLIQRTQGEAEGAVFPVAFNTLAPAPSTKNFYDLFVTTHSSYPGEFDALAFDAAALALQALKTSPSDREDFKKELDRLHDIEGGTGLISIQDHRCVRKLNLYSVSNGKFISVRE